jgi:hypothetical protein
MSKKRLKRIGVKETSRLLPSERSVPSLADWP